MSTIDETTTTAAEEKYIGTLIFGESYFLGRRHCRAGEAIVFSAAEVEHIKEDPFERFRFEPYSGASEVGRKFAKGETWHDPEE